MASETEGQEGPLGSRHRPGGTVGGQEHLSPPALPQDCLDRSFRAQVFSCPACRYDLGRSYAMHVNQPLQAVLNQLFPGYGSGR